MSSASSVCLLRTNLTKLNPQERSCAMRLFEIERPPCRWSRCTPISQLSLYRKHSYSLLSDDHIIISSASRQLCLTDTLFASIFCVIITFTVTYRYFALIFPENWSHFLRAVSLEIQIGDCVSTCFGFLNWSVESCMFLVTLDLRSERGQTPEAIAT